MTPETESAEAARVAALRSFAVLDTPPEADFDDLCKLAAAVCGTPIALVSLIDPARQWFKSRVGLDATETPRGIAFCTHAIEQDDLFTVADAAADARFQDNPLVTGDPFIRFYSGMPLATPEGYNLGTLCVIDRRPRELTADQRAALRVLGRQVVAQLVLRRQVRQLADELAARERAEAAGRETEERFRAFMENGPALAYMKDAAGRFAFVNGPLCRRFGIPEAGWLGKDDVQMWGADVAAPLTAIDAHVLATGETAVVVESVPTPDGLAARWRSYKFPLTAADGRRYLAGMSLDVTAEEAAAAAVRDSEERFRSLVAELAEGVVVFALDGRAVLQSNRAFHDIVGYTEAELAGLTQYDIVGHDKDDIDREMGRIVARGRADIGHRRYRKNGGDVVDVSVSGSLVKVAGKPALCLVVRDVTEQKQYEEQLFRYQADLETANGRLRAIVTTDGLTGLKNRSAFDAKLADEFERAGRYRRPLSVIMLDVDYFKSYNDEFGHPAGDDALKAVARILQDAARGTDFVARYGGEEFACVLPDTDYTGAMVLAERCRRLVAGHPWRLRPITVSVGAATLTDGVEKATVLVGEADDALYRSKRTGRNRVNHGSATIPLAAAMRG